MNEYGNLAKNTIIFAIGQFSVKLIQFFLMPVLTIALSTEAYGSAESLASLVELVIPLLTLGLQDAVFRFCMRKDINKKSVLSSTMAVVMIGMALLLLCAFGASFKISIMQCVMFVVLYVCYALTNIFGQYLRGCGKVKTFASCGIVQALMLAAATAVFVYWQRWSTFGYLLSMATAYAVSLLVMIFGGKIYKDFSFKAIDKSVLKEMIKYALPLIPNAISWWFIQVINRYVIIGFIDEAAAGLFISSAKIATIINIFGTVFLQAWTISTVNSLDDEKKSEFNTRICKAFGIFIQAAAFGILLLLPFVSKFLLQGEFYEAWRYSAISIYTAVLSCYSSFFGAYYGANMKTKWAFFSTLSGAIVNTAACFLLVWLCGIEGALYASMLGYLVLAIVRIVTTQKYSEIKVNWIKEAAAMILLLLNALLIVYFNDITQWWYWVVQVVVICIFAVISFKDIKIFVSSLKSFFKNYRDRKKNAVTEEKNESGNSVKVPEDASECECTEETSEHVE